MIVARHRTILPAFAAAAAGMLATQSAAANDWATPGLDEARARLSAERSGERFGDGRWTAKFAGGAGVLASPVVAEGLIVAADVSGTVRALRAEDGQLAWTVTAGSNVQGTPAVDRGRVFVPTVGGAVMALRLADGARLWSRDVGMMTLSSPTPTDGDVVLTVGFPGKSVIRLSGATGDIVWQSPPVMEQFSNSSPAVGGGLVVAGATGGKYYAFDAATGAPRWTYVADGIVHLASPIIAGGRVYMAGGNDSHHVHAVDAATGVALPGWPIELPTPAPDVTGHLMDRHRAVSSFASTMGYLVLETRLDDALDLDGDGTVDETLSREIVVALDGTSGAVVWQTPRARKEISNPNAVPKFFICPTPAAFGTEGATALLAVASSLDATVVVLDAKTGSERARHAVAGPALASPVMANGRLHVMAMSGQVEGLLSSFNHPPSAAILAGNARPLEAGNVVLRWTPAYDPDAELPSYELRIDRDGEVLQSWEQRIFLSAGTTSAQIASSLIPGQTYTFSVRARDARGALSPWSLPQTFSVFENPSVTIAGSRVASLSGAIQIARPGDAIVLGPGVYRVSDTVRLPGGVSLQGAGPGRTTLDVSGLAVGINIRGDSAGRGTTIDGFTVTGAETCLQVDRGARNVGLRHIVAHDCRVDAIAVAETSEVAIANTTLVGNGTGVHAAGATTVKNSLISHNAVGLAGEANGALTSTFNDIFGNETPYSRLTAGLGDFSGSVSFADFLGHDLRLLDPGVTTDKGDPADAVGAEPAPNGGRINLGAFGGTADAETSAPSRLVAGGGASPTPTASPGVSGEKTAPEGAGCAVSGSTPNPAMPISVLASAALLLVGTRTRRRR